MASVHKNVLLVEGSEDRKQNHMINLVSQTPVHYIIEMPDPN